MFRPEVIKGMNGKIALAPCGHTGETIIGTFVKCLVGCDGKPTLSKRAEIGHVVNCTCTGCKIRAKSEYIVLRTRKGTSVATVPWDGVVNELVFVPISIFTITNYRFVDKLGMTIAQGAIEEETLFSGRATTINMKSLIAAVDGGYAKEPFDIAPPQPAPNPPGHRTIAQAVHAFQAVSGTAPAPASAAPVTVATIEAAMKRIVDVLEVTVSQTGTTVYITLDRVTLVADQMAGWRNNRNLIIQDMQDWCKNNLPAGVAYRVMDKTAKSCLHWAIEDFQLECKLHLQQPANLLKYVTDHLLMVSGYGASTIKTVPLSSGKTEVYIHDKWGVTHVDTFTP